MRRPARLLLLLLMAAAAPLAGCKMVAALGVLFAPRQWQDPEFKFTEGQLAILIDYARPAQMNPVFDLNLHKQLSDLLRTNKVPSRIVPYDDVTALRQKNSDFSSWSIQRTGSALKADQVLCIRILDLQALPNANQAVLAPEATLTLKVIGVNEPTVHARLWPDRDAEPDGRQVTHHRQPFEPETAELIDRETAKLARETAYYVARHFYRYDAEENPPREP
ncbi:MAG: hypothetical protein PVJ57_21465 [Phycisphaerae bacterium]|jgi:hypothetical protein